MKKFLISRTDNLGDVVLTLPLAGVLKEIYPDCKIYFLGKKYTKPLVDASCYIDEFVDWEEIALLPENAKINALRQLKADVIIHVFPNRAVAKLAWKAKIPVRIGTARRTFHLLTCNRKVNYSRRKSSLHEVQLNLKLLAPLGLKRIIPLNEIPKYYGLKKINPVNPFETLLLNGNKFNLVIHPKSKGSAREWGLDNFSRLVEILPQDKFHIFITGTADEGKIIHGFIDKYKEKTTDLTGRLSLADLISFLGKVDGIVAASTGPLHIASALGIYALGIYAPLRPIFPRRWAPVGLHSDYLVLNKKCSDCKKTKDCFCIRSISPESVVEKIMLAASSKTTDPL